MGKWCQSNRIQAVGRWWTLSSWPTSVTEQTDSMDILCCFLWVSILLSVIWESRPNGYQGPFNFQNGREIRESLFWFIHCSYSLNLKCPPASGPSVGVPTWHSLESTEKRISSEGQSRSVCLWVCGEQSWWMPTRRLQHPVDGTVPMLVTFGYLRKHESVSKSGSSIPP